MADATDELLESMFGPWRDRTLEEISLDDELENDIPTWPTPEYTEARLKELKAIRPRSADVIAEEIWLAGSDEDQLRLATAYRAHTDFMGPTLADQAAETEKAKQEAENLRPAFQREAKRLAGVRVGTEESKALRKELEQAADKAILECLVTCARPTGDHTRKELAEYLYLNTPWPSGWPNPGLKQRGKGRRIHPRRQKPPITAPGLMSLSCRCRPRGRFT